jgi:hypothetical protein
MIFEPIAVTGRYEMGLILLGKLRWHSRISGGYKRHGPCSPRSTAVRALMICFCVALGGCPVSAIDERGPLAADDDGNPAGGAAKACVFDEDCVLVGPKCCDCPTFSLPEDDPIVKSCSGVPCPATTCPDNVEARCVQSTCELVCKPLACGVTCDDGFARDDNGCMSCTCAALPPAGGCGVDADCVRTREDCCGCARGGEDTAVLVAQRDAYDAALGCSPTPTCPDMDTCGDETAQCVQGRCELLGPLPANACGRPDLPPCVAGSTCMVNASDQADLHGVGICIPQ